MLKFLRSIFLVIVLLGCSKKESGQAARTTDSSEVDKDDSVRSPVETIDGYQASLIYSDIDSDSLMIDAMDLRNLISLFKTTGKVSQEKEYSGGDCGGKFIRLEYGGDALTINKYSCGDYGFGNSQYLHTGDSLKLVRKYTMEWSIEGDKTEFIVTEKIYEFDVGDVTISERMKVIKEWQNFDFRDIPYGITTSDGQIDYVNLKKEQSDLLRRGTLIE